MKGYPFANLLLWCTLLITYVNSNPFELADKAIKSGDKALAESHLLKEAQSGSQRYLALYKLGTLRWEAKDKEGALHYFTKALELNPNYAGAYYGIGKIYFDLGDYKTAKTNFKTFYKVDENNPEVTYYLAEIYYMEGKFAEAFKLYKKTITLGREMPEVYVSMAEIRYDRSNPKRVNEALEYSRKAIELDPGLGAAYLNLGYYLMDAGNASTLNPTVVELFKKGFERADHPEAAHTYAISLYTCGSNHEDDPYRVFKKSQEMFLKQLNLPNSACQVRIVRNWKKEDDVEMSILVDETDDFIVPSYDHEKEVEFPGHYIYRALLKNVWIYGSGIIRDECRFFVTSHDALLPLHRVPFTEEIYLDQAISLIQMSSDVFFHWIAECIPRLLFVVSLLDEEPEMRLIVPDATFVRETLAMLRIGDKFGHHIVFYTASLKIHVKRLYIVDWRTHALKITQKSQLDKVVLALTPPREGIQRVRSRLSPAVFDENEIKYVIWISRRGLMNKRRSTNEEQVLELIEQMIQLYQPSLELRVFDAANYTLSQSILLFQRAQIVIGIHGGGLINALFSAPHTALIEIGLIERQASLAYRYIAAAMDLEYYVVPGAKECYFYCNFDVSLDNLKKTLNQVLMRRYPQAKQTCMKEECVQST